jgi:hypothetical protein
LSHVSTFCFENRWIAVGKRFNKRMEVRTKNAMESAP